MSATCVVAPVAGPLFKQAARLQVGGQKRRRVLCLLAAYADADPSYRPSVAELAGRLGYKPARLVALADALERDGWITVHRRRRGRALYALHLDRQAVAR
jgi:DNA-binding MarR family transcriptional regulator